MSSVTNLEQTEFYIVKVLWSNSETSFLTKSNDVRSMLYTKSGAKSCIKRFQKDYEENGHKLVAQRVYIKLGEEVNLL